MATCPKEWKALERKIRKHNTWTSKLISEQQRLQPNRLNAVEDRTNKRKDKKRAKRWHKKAAKRGRKKKCTRGTSKNMKFRKKLASELC